MFTVHGTCNKKNEPASIRLMLIEDNAIYRAGLSSMLGLEYGIDVVAQYASPARAIPLMPHAAPDVVLLGVDDTGQEAEEALTRLLPALPRRGQVVVLGGHGDASTGQDLVRLGARAYLPKDVTPSYLVSVICMAHFYGRRTAVPPDAVPVRSRAADVTLSTREREIVRLVAKAMTNAQIGRHLHITEGTVKRHLSNVFNKLHAVSRMDAVNKASAACLIE
ncbi:response regulator transcription factor [Streptomyces roseoverticillatus]|uniref:Response regulator transcription factor n=1 Tax=Streptomyces roseoverticillatus TaxID=66429 RepID=A0ABV3J5U0_9ACTN